jgi:hypothetical protein
MMLIRIMEDSPDRLRDLARAWGADPRAVPSKLVARIEAAYRREVEDEERRAMRDRWLRRARERAA